jgi:hypothetical protein
MDPLLRELLESIQVDTSAGLNDGRVWLYGSVPLAVLNALRVAAGLPPEEIAEPVWASRPEPLEDHGDRVPWD